MHPFKAAVLLLSALAVRSSASSAFRQNHDPWFLDIQRRSNPPNAPGSSLPQEGSSNRQPQSLDPNLDFDLQLGGYDKRERQRIKAAHQSGLISTNEMTVRATLAGPGNPVHAKYQPGQVFKPDNLASSDWHKQLPPNIDNSRARLKVRKMERQQRAFEAVCLLEIPPDAGPLTKAVQAHQIRQALNSGALKPESVLKGRKPEDVIKQLGEKTKLESTENTLESQKEEKGVADRVVPHGSIQVEEAEKIKAEKKSKKNARRKARRKASKGNKLGTVDEDAPQREPSLPRARSGSSSAHTDDDTSSLASSVVGEHPRGFGGLHIG